MRVLRLSVWSFPTWAVLFSAVLSTAAFAAAPDRISGAIDASQTVVLANVLRHQAQPSFDQGPVDLGLKLNGVTLLTVPSPSQQNALNLLLAEQQDHSSPNYHKWLTPEQYADRFGLSRNDIQQISAWLKGQGLTSISVARARNWIVFSGTASQIQSVFRTEIHRYNVNGEMHFANSSAPSIPAALSGIVTGIRGLDDFHPKPMNVRKAAPQKANPDYYDGNFQIPDFVAPGDITTIYDLSPLYNAGYDGTGQKLVIVGETDVYLADLNDFRSGFGLPAITGCTTTGGVITSCTTSATANFQYVLDGTDPGVATPASSVLNEADLDLEWSAAVAPGAQIIYVNSTDVFTSYYYAIDQDLAPVMSMSFGICEWDNGGNIETSTGASGPDEIELKKANSEGITFLNSSGDSGAAECDPPQTGSDPNGLAIGGLAVSYPASSPEVTGVGGTAIAYPSGFSSTYWATPTTNPTNGGTAQNPPLPETSWNDDEELAAAYGGQTALQIQESYAIVSSGGGPSNCAEQNANFSACVAGFAQPSWQTVTIPAQTALRFTPDVSLLASPNFPGYVYCTPVEDLSTTSPYDTETTSSCATSIMDAVNGVCSGTCNGSNTVVNPSLVGGTSASSPVFAAMVTILNQYLNGTSSSGLGNINPTLYTLAKTPSNSAFHQVTTGDNTVYCSGDTPAPPWPAALQCPGAVNTTESFGFQASNADTTTGYNLVTGLGSVDANNLFIAWAATLPSFTLASAPGTVSVAAGTNSSPIAVTVTPGTGFTGTVAFSCTGLPVGVTCSFSPASSSTATSLIVQTAANTAAATTSITVTGTSGGVSKTATVSLTVTATAETFAIATGSTNSFSVMAGAAASVPITVTSTSTPSFIVTNGGNSTTTVPVTYTCSGLPSEANCNFSPAMTSSSTSVTLSVTTTAPTAQLRRPLDHGSRMLYALLLPGLFGIVFVAGSRKSSARGVRVLGLILVLGFSTMWLGSCGGNSTSSSSSNPGTPAGSYPITVTGNAGGSVPNATLTFTLVVTQ